MEVHCKVAESSKNYVICATADASNVWLLGTLDSVSALDDDSGEFNSDLVQRCLRKPFSMIYASNNFIWLMLQQLHYEASPSENHRTASLLQLILNDLDELSIVR